MTLDTSPAAPLSRTLTEDAIVDLVAGAVLACIRSRNAADRSHIGIATAIVGLLKAEKLLVL